MIECANCGKELRDNFIYCRICGTKLGGGEPGDYSTDMLNVFKHGDDYIYLFSENGNQVILKAGTLDELAVMVGEKKYPWEFRDWNSNLKSHKSETAEIPELKSDFMNPGGMNDPEFIPSSSARKHNDDFSVQESEVETVENDSIKKDGESGLKLHGKKDYVESIEDVGFGKIMDRNVTGCVPTVWGPDNSSRAINLRQSMFR